MHFFLFVGNLHSLEYKLYEGKDIHQAVPENGMGHRGGAREHWWDGCLYLGLEDVQREALNYLVSGPPSDYRVTEPQGMLGRQELKTIPCAPLQDLLEWLGLNQGGLLYV